APTSPWGEMDGGGDGAFTMGKALKVKDFSDGLSKTAFFSERTKGTLQKPGSVIVSKDDIVHCPGVTPSYNQVRYPDSNSDTIKFYNNALTYQPKMDSSSFTGTGRWDKGDTTGSGNGQSYTDGWPVGMYVATQYNHVAPPNFQGYDCGAFSGIPDT